MSEEVFTRWIDPTIEEKDKEIKRLNKCIKDDKENADEIIAEQQREIERLHSIIKEVREYIERRDIDWGSDEHNHVLEILDKE